MGTTVKDKLLLASASPRRRQILTGLGLDFDVIVPLVDELALPDEPARTALVNARLKFDWAEARHAGRRIIAADTVIDFDGRLVSKPLSLAEAADMLRAFSGRTHRVFTGVALSGRPSVALVASDVTFRPLSVADIEAYLSQINPLDRAGGYDIDEGGEQLVAGYVGSRTNIMGLSEELVSDWLRCG